MQKSSSIFFIRTANIMLQQLETSTKLTKFNVRKYFAATEITKLCIKNISYDTALKIFSLGNLIFKHINKNITLIGNTIVDKSVVPTPIPG